ncbi:MAG TPA: RodZ domain-containing protein [Burkholderiales bacterium]|nr:RodZ domain-containing protein [Burkholderiales bacterium]
MSTHTTVPPSETPASAPRPNGPGSQLRQARLDLKLTPENVAHILHLSPRQIVALENDEYDKLPGPTYVRGYLRGYAQLLGLSAEPVVESYSRSVTTSKPIDLSKLAPKPEIRSDHQLIKFATLGVIAIVLSLSALWWQERDRPATPVSVPEATSPSAPAATTEAEPTDTDVATNAPTKDTPAVDASRNVPTPAAKSPTVVSPERTVTTSPTPAPTVPVTGPRMRLMIQTPVDCWADVRDAGGNRLLYETIRAGHTSVVEGAAPLSVFLGNVEGLRVEVNGQPYDVAPHRRGDVARFTVSENRQ